MDTVILNCSIKSSQVHKTHEIKEVLNMRQLCAKKKNRNFKLSANSVGTPKKKGTDKKLVEKKKGQYCTTDRNESKKII